MRHLVACAACARQIDASSLAPGDRFRCLCGRAVRVPEPDPQDAAVVRCSSCGAPRREGSATCSFCGSDFTLHERDLHTLCPACMARISDRARYCHHCATPILPEETAGESTDRSCPACGPPRSLRSRALGSPPLPMMECPGCAGLWLGNDTFQLLLQRARTAEAPESAAAGGTVPPMPGGEPEQVGSFYRPCPVCGDLMHRRNFGRKSGVLLDSCSRHGVWFDAAELERTLTWVRSGGERQAGRRLAEEKSQEERSARLHRREAAAEEPRYPGGATGPGLLELLEDLLRLLR